MYTHPFRRAGIVLCACILLIFGSPASSKASAITEHFDASYPIISQEITWDCLGSGESIIMNGTIHIQGHVTYDANGIGHFFVEQNMQGVSGVGLTTGTVYQFIDSRPQNASDHLTTSSGKESIFVITTHIIGQGPANNLLDHETYHAIYNANGELTTYLDKITFDCGSNG